MDKLRKEFMEEFYNIAGIIEHGLPLYDEKELELLTGCCERMQKFAKEHIALAKERGDLD